MAKKMQAYLNKPELKDLLVKEIGWHEEQDAILQGTYGIGSGKNWKGCAIGCSIACAQKLLELLKEAN